MIRPLMLAALLMAPPALAENAAEKQQRCEIQAGIVRQAVDLRAKRKSQKRTTRKIIRSDAIAGTKYESNVDVLVQWVFGLPDDQLSDDAVTAFETACNQYQQ